MGKDKIDLVLCDYGCKGGSWDKAVPICVFLLTEGKYLQLWFFFEEGAACM